MSALWDAVSADEAPNFEEIEAAVNFGLFDWDTEPGLTNPELVWNTAEYKTHIRTDGSVPFGDTYVMDKAEFEAYAWEPDPPTGVSVDVEQPAFSGGDVEATWINAGGVDDYSINVEWEINSTSFRIDTESPNSTISILEEAALSDGDEVRARMRYFYKSVVGDWGPWGELTPPYVA